MQEVLYRSGPVLTEVKAHCTVFLLSSDKSAVLLDRQLPSAIDLLAQGSSFVQTAVSLPSITGLEELN